MQRTANCLRKLERMNKTLRHQEADRVPVSDFFWGSFLERWRRDLGLPCDTDIYRYYDLDWIVTIPNMDPKITPFQVLSQDDEQVIVRTGFGAVIRKRYDYPMPAFLGFETDSIKKAAAFQFDDAWDERRFFRAGDNQIAGVGDGFRRDLPPWIETVNSLYPDFPVFGSICEGQEMLWRIIGSENVMLFGRELRLRSESRARIRPLPAPSRRLRPSRPVKRAPSDRTHTSSDPDRSSGLRSLTPVQAVRASSS